MDVCAREYMRNLANDSSFKDKQTDCVNITAHPLEAACSMYLRCPLQPVQKPYSINPLILQRTP